MFVPLLHSTEYVHTCNIQLGFRHSTPSRYHGFGKGKVSCWLWGGMRIGSSAAREALPGQSLNFSARAPGPWHWLQHSSRVSLSQDTPSLLKPAETTWKSAEAEAEVWLTLPLPIDASLFLFSSPPPSACGEV